MKLLILSMLSSLLINVSPLYDREDVITFEELPVVAQQFLKKHFAEEKILSVVCEREIGDKEYSVYYYSGLEVKFDRRGEWECVEYDHSVVPDSVIPENILSTVKAKHPDKKITSITRDLTGRDKGYEVDLDDVMEMKFDLNGKFIRYDD